MLIDLSTVTREPTHAKLREISNNFTNKTFVVSST